MRSGRARLEITVHVEEIIRVSDIFVCATWFKIEGVTATRCFSPFFIISRKTQKNHRIWQFSNYVDFSCINEQDMFNKSEFRRFCNDSTALSEKK